MKSNSVLKRLRTAALVAAVSIAVSAVAGLEIASTKYGVVPSHAAITPPFTYCAWVKLYSKAASGTVLSIAGTTDNYHQLQWNSPTASWLTWSRQFGTANTAIAYGTNFGTVSTNVWYFVAGVHSAIDNRIIYINGSPYGTNTDSRSVTNSKVGVGARVEGAIPSASPEYFNGQIAEIGIWNVALTASELAQLGGNGNPSLAVSPIRIRPDKLILYAPLNCGTTAHERNAAGNPIALSNAPAKISTFLLTR